MSQPQLYRLIACLPLQTGLYTSGVKLELPIWNLQALPKNDISYERSLALKQYLKGTS